MSGRVAKLEFATRRLWPGITVLGTTAMPMFGQQVEEDIRGPKELIEIPVPELPTPWGLYSLVALSILLLIVGLIWWWKSRRPQPATAEETARRALMRLEREGGELAAGDFAAGASLVVREFIEKRFGIAAPRRTTEEFLHEMSMGGQPLLQSRSESLKEFLKSCDMAKFAATELAVGGRGALVAKARAFVDEPKEVRS